MPQSLWDMLNGGGLTYNSGPQPQTPGLTYNNNPMPASFQNTTIGKPTYSSVLGASIRPQTSGAAPQGPVAGPSAPQQQPQQQSQPSELDILRGQYDNTRNYLQSLAPGYDDAYNAAKNTVQTAEDNATNTYNTQDQQNTQDYGKLLKSQIQTYNDLGNKYNSYYSGNGLLDSTMYDTANNKNKQALFDAQTGTQQQQQNSHNSLQSNYNAYKGQADQALQGLSSDYQRNKAGLLQMQGSNAYGEAQALRDAQMQAQQYAQSIQQNQQNWATQAAILGARGVDVTGALQAINAGQYGSNVGNQLASANSQFGSLLQGQNQGQQQGQYTGRSGKRYNTPQEAILAGDI